MRDKLLSLTSLLLLIPACASAQRDTAEPSDDAMADATVPERTAPPVLYEPNSSIDPVVARRMAMRMTTQEAIEAELEHDAEPLATDMVAPTMSAACGWEQPTFFFATDDADVGFLGDIKMDALADCLTSKPLHDEPIVVVGHADTRGDAYENLELGLDRANAVKSQLVALGVSPTRIETYSSGEYRTDNDDSNLDDRRVVVKLDR
ncbi:MAG: OmpA family protein [Nannocystaceae bacterium]|nr:OmpA family protein [bacterium]